MYEVEEVFAASVLLGKHFQSFPYEDSYDYYDEGYDDYYDDGDYYYDDYYEDW